MAKLIDFLYGIKTGKILLYKGVATEGYIENLLKDNGLYKRRVIKDLFGRDYTDGINYSLGLGETEYPWEDVLRCIDMPINTPKGFEKFTCPYCKNDDFIWIYFTSPAWTWKHLCGRAGPLCICPKCASQIYFACEIMN